MQSMYTYYIQRLNAEGKSLLPAVILECGLGNTE